MGSAAPSSYDVESGSGNVNMPGTAVRSCAPPYAPTAATRWPGSKPAPLTTVPATSTPSENGGSGFSWYSPLLSSRSGNEMPTRCTSISTSSGPGAGSGTSRTCDVGGTGGRDDLGCAHGLTLATGGATSQPGLTIRFSSKCIGSV